MDQDQLNLVFEDPPDALIYNFMKNFIARLSCGYVHVEVSSIIIDALLTKKHKVKNDLYLVRALAVIFVLLKDHGIKEAKSASDLIRVVEKKAKTEIFEYEFFKLFKHVHFDETGL